MPAPSRSSAFPRIHESAHGEGRTNAAARSPAKTLTLDVVDMCAASLDDAAPRDDADKAQLMERVQLGDVVAFEQLVAALWSSTFRYAHSLVDDEDRATDVAQECFVRLWQKRHEWKPSGAISVWLLRTARNLVISEQRRWKVRLRWASLVSREEKRRQPRTPLQELEAEELRVAMERAIQRLSPRRREVFTLFHLQDFSYREIAEVMEIRPQTVANYLQAAIADLRISLSPFFPALSTAEHPDSTRSPD